MLQCLSKSGPFHLAVRYLFLIAFSATTGMCAILLQQDLGKPDRAAIKNRIGIIIQQTIEQSHHKVPGGYASTRPFLPSSEALEEVKKFGDEAIEVLSEYLNSSKSYEQEVALRLLGQFKGEKSLQVFRGFAQQAKSSSIRSLALSWLTQFPSDRALPIIKESSINDPDLAVRKDAERLLDHYPAEARR